MSLFEINNLNAFYGQVQVLHDLSLRVEENEIVTIIGANSAGKKHFHKNNIRFDEECTGEITFLGDRIDGLPPHEIVEKGIVQIPEGRKLFPFFTVMENLEIGAHTARAAKDIKETMEEVLELFPKLKQRSNQLARTLSGGEQQMLAIARGLMAKPKLLMFDEPSLDLLPFGEKCF